MNSSPVICFGRFRVRGFDLPDLVLLCGVFNTSRIVSETLEEVELKEHCPGLWTWLDPLELTDCPNLSADCDPLASEECPADRDPLA
jgi:hypothetical protein